MADYLPKNRSKMLMAWLKEASPDQWHQVASDWNWGSGEDALRWIIEQPKCDKATALLIFWRGEPSYYWTEATNRDGLKAAGALGDGGVYDMLVAIVARWKAGRFTRAELSYDPSQDVCASTSDVTRSANHPALAITEEMIQPIMGREVERGDYNEGIPHHIEIASR